LVNQVLEQISADILEDLVNLGVPVGDTRITDVMRRVRLGVNSALLSCGVNANVSQQIGDGAGSGVGTGMLGSEVNLGDNDGTSTGCLPGLTPVSAFRVGLVGLGYSLSSIDALIIDMALSDESCIDLQNEQILALLDQFYTDNPDGETTIIEPDPDEIDGCPDGYETEEAIRGGLVAAGYSLSAVDALISDLNPSGENCVNVTDSSAISLFAAFVASNPLDDDDDDEQGDGCVGDSVSIGVIEEMLISDGYVPEEIQGFLNFMNTNEDACIETQEVLDFTNAYDLWQTSYDGPTAAEPGVNCRGLSVPSQAMRADLEADGYPQAAVNVLISVVDRNGDACIDSILESGPMAAAIDQFIATYTPAGGTVVDLSGDCPSGTRVVAELRAEVLNSGLGTEDAVDILLGALDSDSNGCIVRQEFLDAVEEYAFFVRSTTGDVDNTLVS
jgi:hypothetical protein